MFAWSSGLLVALVTAFLLSAKGGDPFLHYGSPGRWVASITVCMLAGFSALWQNHQREYRRGHQRVLSRISSRLGAFEPDIDGGSPLYPCEWRSWGHEEEMKGAPWRRPSKFYATILLGAVALLGIWVPWLIAS